jgi:hypothetical protein
VRVAAMAYAVERLSFALQELGIGGRVPAQGRNLTGKSYLPRCPREEQRRCTLLLILITIIILYITCTRRKPGRGGREEPL